MLLIEHIASTSLEFHLIWLSASMCDDLRFYRLLSNGGEKIFTLFFFFGHENELQIICSKLIEN